MKPSARIGGYRASTIFGTYLPETGMSKKPFSVENGTGLMNFSVNMCRRIRGPDKGIALCRHADFIHQCYDQSTGATFDKFAIAPNWVGVIENSLLKPIIGLSFIPNETGWSARANDKDC